jgi:hypothetical protein
VYQRKALILYFVVCVVFFVIQVFVLYGYAIPEVVAALERSVDPTVADDIRAFINHIVYFLVIWPFLLFGVLLILIRQMGKS